MLNMLPSKEEKLAKYVEKIAVKISVRKPKHRRNYINYEEQQAKKEAKACPCGKSKKRRAISTANNRATPVCSLLKRGREKGGKGPGGSRSEETAQTQPQARGDLTQCRRGPTCRDALRTGKCAYWHPKAEWAELTKKFRF